MRSRRSILIIFPELMRRLGMVRYCDTMRGAAGVQTMTDGGTSGSVLLLETGGSDNLLLETGDNLLLES